MDATRWETVKELFEQASYLEPDERARQLEQLYASDPEAAAALESLLAAAGEADPFFDQLADEILSRPPWLEDADTGGDGPDPLLGQSVRQYEIEERLGRGGMGVVYRTRDTRLDRTVALKFLPPHLSADEAATDRFIVEARAAAALDHPNICNVHEIAEDDEGRLFIAMALYEGETLKEKIARGPLPIDEALDYTRQVAAGLQAAHAREIIHRDVKPGNVIVTHDGLAKILDFGLAKLTDVTLTASKATMGTVAYLSPEQAQGQPLDHRTDLWSLGVVLYEMLTGERPFKGDRSAVVIHGILNQDPTPVSTLRPEVPSGVEALVTRLLAKDTDERLESAGVLAEVLAGPDASGGLQPASFKERLVRPAGLLTVAAALLVAVLAAWWLITSSSSTRVPAAVEEGPIRSLAVLPLQNLSGDPEEDDFVNAMHHAMITELAQLERFSVVARRSTLAYRDTDSSIQEIADDLRVDALIEGTVYREGDEVMISVSLTRARPERQLWGAGIGGSMDRLFALHAEVARRVAEATDAPLTAAEAARLAEVQEVDPEAYILYTRGLDYYGRSVDSDDIQNAIQLFQQAIDIDADYAQAYAMLAFTLAWASGAPPFPALQDSAHSVLDRALELDPGLPEVQFARGVLATDAEEQFGAYLTALSARPVPELEAAMQDAIGARKRALGDMDEAAAHYERAVALNPRSGALLVQLQATYVMARDYEGYARTADRALAIAPDEPFALWMKAYQLLLTRGDAEGAREWFSRAARVSTVLELFQGMAMWGYRMSIPFLTPELRNEILATPWTRFEAVGLPRPYYHMVKALANEWTGEADAALAHDDSARVELEQGTHCGLSRLGACDVQLGLAYASLGRQTDAIQAAEAGVARYRNAFFGPMSRRWLAEVYMRVGEHESAIDELEYLLTIPSWESVPYYRVDPTWDPLRDHPRFQALIEG